MLDVSDILSDPDFYVEFEIMRRVSRVDEHGRNHVSGEKSIISGSIQPATPKEIEKLPEADRERETIAVYSISPFHSSGSEHAADVIFWKGRAYEVAAIESWPGWNKALAQLLPEDENGQ